MQDVFLKLWENGSDTKIHTNLKAYLYTSVKNTCINFLKRENLFSSFGEDDLADGGYKSAYENFEHSEIQRQINRAINKLPDKCRRIFMMCKYDNLSYAEIAAIQNISINTVKTQLKRAVKTLAKNLSHLRSIVILIQFVIWSFLEN